MFSSNRNKIPKGDHVTKEEAVMDKDADVLYRCETVFDVILDNTLTLDQALKAYNITIEQFLGYMMLKTKRIKITPDYLMIAAFVHTFFELMDWKKARLDTRSNKLLEDMRQLVSAK